jgi:hypothetical protein
MELLCSRAMSTAIISILHKPLMWRYRHGWLASSGLRKKPGWAHPNKPASRCQTGPPQAVGGVAQPAVDLLLEVILDPGLQTRYPRDVLPLVAEVSVREPGRTPTETLRATRMHYWGG